MLYNIPRAERRARTEALLTFVELWDRRDSLVQTFSGGMKRRLEIARGLLHRPKIIFLDEPTLGLDPQTRNHMWQYLQELNAKEGTTIFFSTHYMEEAERVAKRISIIDKGTIIASGSARRAESANKHGKSRRRVSHLHRPQHPGRRRHQPRTHAPCSQHDAVNE